MAWEKAAGETKAVQAASRAAANPKTTKNEPEKESKAALEEGAAERPPATKMAAEKAANLAASLTGAEAATAAPKKAAADKAADRATMDASLQFDTSCESRCRFSETEGQEIKNIDVLACLVVLTSHEGLPIAKSMCNMLPNNLSAAPRNGFQYGV